MKTFQAWLLGLAHGSSDASAGLLVGMIIQHRSTDMNSQILLYNLIAFGLQPLAGLLIDQSRRARQAASASMLLTILGLLVSPYNLVIAILLIGAGSAGLHAGGGAVILTNSPGKASPAGIFAAFGVVGLALGGIASIEYGPAARIALTVILTLLALMILITPSPGQSTSVPVNTVFKPDVLIGLILVGAIALRSTAWVGTQIQIPRYSTAAVIIALAAGFGKLFGGYAADYFGWKRWMLAATFGATWMLFFANQDLLFLIPGVFLLQSVTPLSIAAAGKFMPASPALAASLATGAAIILGGLPFFLIPGGWFNQTVLAIVLSFSILLYWAALSRSQTGNSRQS